MFCQEVFEVNIFRQARLTPFFHCVIYLQVFEQFDSFMDFFICFDGQDDRLYFVFAQDRHLISPVLLDAVQNRLE